MIVTPRDTAAATVTLEVTDTDFVFLHIGRGTTFEIPPWGVSTLILVKPNRFELWQRRLLQVSFEEYLIYRAGMLVSGRGVVHLSERDLTTSWSQLHNPFRGEKRKAHIKYAPYTQE